jgi:5'-3' exonuclease
MRLHLVDGTFELFRAHYSKRPDKRFKATIGLVYSMLFLLSEEAERVTHVAVAFDNPIRSFRNDLFDGYKSDEGMDPELRGQFDLAERATRALGMVTWSMDRWEADDALATAATRWADRVEQVRILTPDKDLGQVLRGQKIVQVDRMRRREIDEEAMFASKGVRPASIPDLLALVGDTADGIPGIPGFGEKTAAALLRGYGHIDAIPDDPARWTVEVRGKDKLASTLREMRQAAMAYRVLATLVTDVPLAESLEDLAWRGVPRDAYEALCAELGSTELLTRPTRWEETGR